VKRRIARPDFLDMAFLPLICMPKYQAGSMTHATGHDLFERALLQLLRPLPGNSAQGVYASPERQPRRAKCAVVKQTQPAGRMAPPARFSVLEVLSDNALSVCLSDPQAGRYAEQVWRSGFARCKARCALSGKPIVRGDRVFRPGRSFICPANSGCMILASSVAPEYS
jgi:hypothetical protein